MDIARNNKLNDPEQKITFCLDQLESAEKFNDKINWGTNIVERLTIEEIIGALVAAEQRLKELEIYKE
jgi:hypothetical protein